MNKRAGMTLLEVVIASTIFVAVIGITMAVLFSGTSLAEKSTISSDLEFRGREMVNFAKAEFLMAKFTGAPITIGGTSYAMGIYTNNTELRYRLPTTRSADGILKYGYEAPNSGLKDNLACFLRFEPETVFLESAHAIPASAVRPAMTWATLVYSQFPLETQVANTDINRDGDDDDTFVRGKIVKYIMAPDLDPMWLAHNRQNILDRSTLSDYVFLRVNRTDHSRFDYDMEGDPLPTPAGCHSESVNDVLFRFVDGAWPKSSTTLVDNTNLTQKGKAIVTMVWHGAYDENNKGMLIRKGSENVRFRNQQ